MSQPNIADMMQQAKQMQARMGRLQEQLAAKRFEAASGGGMVKAQVTGGLRVVGIEIEPSLLSGGDREMLQDLVAAAVNAALENAQRSIQEEMAQMQRGLLGGLAQNLPGMPGQDDR